MKVLVCGGRDYYEFYTQSDAEEVIKNLKNNIAAKDKLIQSLIDFDSEEVKRLEADNTAKDARIAELEAKLETANALVTCCCGSLVNDHDMGSGHSPVDQYHYAMVQLEADNRRLREALESIAGWPNGGKNYGQENIKRFARAALAQGGE